MREKGLNWQPGATGDWCLVHSKLINPRLVVGWASMVVKTFASMELPEMHAREDQAPHTSEKFAQTIEGKRV
jgi:hypothetical protein